MSARLEPPTSPRRRVLAPPFQELGGQEEVPIDVSRETLAQLGPAGR